MPTPFDDIYDLFLVEIKDYKIDYLQAWPTEISNYLQGFLMKAIPDFDNCVQNLEDYNLTNTQFNANLTLTEKSILSNLMVIKWLNKEINDVTQFNLHLNDTDFKHYSEAQNLQQKTSHRDGLREIINQDMTRYGLKNTPWSDWANGNFT